jgi:DNA-binding HxlR family transcriptional regulator
MLSKELKELEMNQLIKRIVLDTQPVTVQYQLTEYGLTLKKSSIPLPNGELNIEK